MEIKRSRCVVDFFNFEKMDVVEKQSIEKELNADLVLINRDHQKVLINTVGVQLTFCFPFDRWVVKGKISQINYIYDKCIVDKADFSEEEMQELLQPLFNTIRRLIYEITEIALDEPGTAVEFDLLAI